MRPTPGSAGGGAPGARPPRGPRPGPRRRGSAARRRPGRRTRRPARAAPPRCWRPSRSGCAGPPGSGHVEQVHAQHQRLQRGVGHPAAGVAEDLGVAGLEAEHAQRVDPGVHAGHDGDAGVGDAVEPAEVKSAANSRLAVSRSSKSATVGRVSGRSAGALAGSRAGVRPPGCAAPRKSTSASAGRDQRADRGPGEDRVLLGDAGDLEQVGELVAAAAAAADLAHGRAGRPARRSSGAARSWSAPRCRPACRPSGPRRPARWPAPWSRSSVLASTAAFTGASASPKPNPPSSSGSVGRRGGRGWSAPTGSSARTPTAASSHAARGDHPGGQRAGQVAADHGPDRQRDQEPHQHQGGQQLGVAVDGGAGEDRDVDQGRDQRGADEEADRAARPRPAYGAARRGGTSGASARRRCTTKATAATAAPSEVPAPCGRRTPATRGPRWRRRGSPRPARRASSSAPARSASRSAAPPAAQVDQRRGPRSGSGPRAAPRPRSPPTPIGVSQRPSPDEAG